MHHRSIPVGVLLAAVFAGLRSAEAADEARLLRFPTIQGDKIAFVCGGDIWTASSSGGTAQRLTSFDAGYELFPRISPDGRWVAFSGEYTGTRQIFVVPYTGGDPRQLTFYPDVGDLPPRGGYDNLAYDWTPDGSHILVRMHRTAYGERIGRYFLVDPNGGLEQPLEIPEGGAATYSPDGSKLAYNIISREWRTWKRYKAGRAQDVYIYDLAQHQIERITDFEGTDNQPCWLGDHIYFTSDRSGTLNLYAYDLRTRETRAITHFTDFDVLFPSRGRGGVIFECGGYLYVMDEGTEAVRKLRIELADDRPWLRPVWKNGAGNVGSFGLSPKAARVVAEVRGDVFSVPADKGQPTNLTRTPDRRERDVAWSPDGKWLSYLAEVGEDYELFLRSIASGEERQLTRGTGSWIGDYAWSPDAKSIAITDRAQRLLVLEVASGEVRERDRGREDWIRSVSWSHDSGWLTYVKQGENGFDSVWVCAADAGDPVQVTSSWFDCNAACFDGKGEYLFFSSARDFDYGDLDFQSRLYALLLRPDVKSPVVPEEDQEPDPALAEADKPKPTDGDKDMDADQPKPAAGEADAGDEAQPAAADAAAPDAPAATPTAKPRFEIAFAGLQDRLVPLPLPPGGYFNLETVDGGFLFVQDGNLRRYDLAKREAKNVLDGVSGYTLNADRSKLLYRSGSGLAIAGTTPGQSRDSGRVPVDRIQVKIDPRTEWAQIYGDAWRIMRDWFYDARMHHVDWRAMRDKYRQLVANVAHRDDLDFILGELIGELNAGHTYVNRGESPRAPRIGVGVLGCEFDRDGDRYRIRSIYRGEPWNAAARAPLAEAGVDARVGDYLLAIDGEELLTSDNPYRLLENKVGVPVKLRLCADRTGAGAREVVVRPLASESELRYLDWVERNRRRVDELSGGRIGYVHVPDTAVAGHHRLFEGFHAQARVKDAMIIDDRYNGGGFIPDRMIREIGMPVLSYWSRRHAELSTTPQFAFEGPMAMLINGYSSSGGDAFPYYFRKMKLGPLIGAKTWGGLVGYSGTPAFVDGGGLAVPAFAFVNTDGEWDVEYVGVAPDIQVFDDPTQIQAGREPVLEFAVKHLLEQLAQQPTRRRPPVPEGPARDR